MTKKHRSSEQGVALIVVLSLVAVMAMLAMVFFSSTAAESQTSQSQSSAQSAQQLASSAAQIVMAQIQLAGNQTAPGNGNAVAWTSQPGLLRTFTPSGASTVYKLYSATSMVTDSFSETEDAPPENWKSSPAIYCDLNAPVARAGNTSLAYPIADPSVAAVSLTSNLTSNGITAVPGFAMNGTAPGYSGSNPSPTNNPLPMPVRWLYVLKNGQLTTPSSVDAGGNVTFSDPPSATNPVVGRIAFWADDETCKVNINTAGYAKNDSNYWTYWDTPIGNTQEENTWLSWAQPWKNEYQRYPGHPASTGLNIVFDSLNLTANQTLTLTPRLKDGGTTGGTIRVTTAPSTAQTTSLLKNERLFPTLDEMFYNPTRGAAAAGIAQGDLEARRFLLTATSRAPETTLFDTPRVTIWPTWRLSPNPSTGNSTRFPGINPRTATDRLIAFCSTIGPDSAPQPFYFVREYPLVSTELTGILQNQNLWNYLQTLSGRTEPGFGGNFGAKYGAQNRDQILTSIHDAIRLANIDERTPPVSGSTGYSFTAGALTFNAGTSLWTPTTSNYTMGYVAPTNGPNGTRGAGRTPALAEVAFLFARTSNNTTLVQDPRDPTNAAAKVPERDIVRVAVLYGAISPAAGFVQPGHNWRIKVTGLSSFTVQAPGQPTPQTIFARQNTTDTAGYNYNVYDRIEYDGNNTSRRELGGRMSWYISQMSKPPGVNPTLCWQGPPTGNVVLPYDPTNQNTAFAFSGGNLNIEVYSPSTATTASQTHQITFPPASALTPLPVATNITNTAWASGSRWGGNPTGTANLQSLYEQRISYPGDTILAMQSNSGDFRSETLRTGTISDFQAHYRYNKTDILSSSTVTGMGITVDQLSRRASSLRWASGNSIPYLPANSALNDQIFGRLVRGFNGYAYMATPAIPSRNFTTSIQETFPPGDFSNGPGFAVDASLSPKTDEGGQVSENDGTPFLYDESPYFRNTNVGTRLSASSTLASPNRQMPSAVFFGSVPTGVYSSPAVPWRTLLFRPDRSWVSGATHFGATNPPDYLMLDWFHMPVVEPYAISEPFSTAGKINLNAQIIPFGNYVRRETSLHALLRSSRVVALSESVVGLSAYSNEQKVSSAPSSTTRYPIDTAETLTLLRKRFDGTDGSGNRVYLTNAEICSIDLVPQGSTATTLSTFWADKRTTGDNSREQPYASLLPRLTAKSNSYTVHVTAQALAPGPGATGWQEGKGKVLSEWRGAYTIERYVDPNDARFTGAGAPDFLSGTQPVGPYYRFRVLGTRRFNP